MTEPKRGPFDVALFTLRQKLQSWIDVLEDCERAQKYTGAEDGAITRTKARMDDIRVAIRVLEAAGKVDKALFLKGRMSWHLPSRRKFTFIGVEKLGKQIRALLEGLPEPGKED